MRNFIIGAMLTFALVACEDTTTTTETTEGTKGTVFTGANDDSGTTTNANTTTTTDETTTTPALQDQNIMYVKLYVKPAKAIEYIVVDFMITDSGFEF
mgnify:CR=1 FL=1